MASYDSIRNTLKTGDVVIFSGKSAVSNFIKLFSGGKWSHVGMVLRLKELDDAVLLWESTTSATFRTSRPRPPQRACSSCR
jgi:hypothetical protein